ncbi:MAG: TIGR00282 family metallophosphoesterase [Nitrospinota bacterium]
MTEASGIVRILFISDIVGKPGRRILRERLAESMAEHNVDFCVANGENAAGGVGLTGEVADELFRVGVQVLTSGNHIWGKREILDLIPVEPRILRPANYPPGTPGRGAHVYQASRGVRVGVLNLFGRVFSPFPLDCPFRAATEQVERLRAETPVILVDMHAEATSEKIAMGWFLDGQVSAVLGTHTHVQTCDERILPGGTAYITDVGMTGPWVSVIGVKRDLAIQRFLTALPQRFEPASGPAQLNAVFLTVDGETGRALSIERIRIEEPAPT